MRKLMVTGCITAALAVAAGCREDSPQVQTAEQSGSLDRVKLATARGEVPTIGGVEPAALFYGPMPTGVAVSRENRLFVCYPRWGDPVEYTVAEVTNGKAKPYPNLEINRLDKSRPKETFVSVQSVYVDDNNRLWVLDTGSVNFTPVVSGGAKLIAYDLSSNQEVKRIEFPRDVALPTSYLNDVRFDLKRGARGTAYLTDSSDKGTNGIVVVDLASGRSWRKLHGHPSTRAEPDFAPVVEGRKFMARPPKGPEAYVKVGSDGIALTPDGKTLYYRPLIGRRLYSIDADLLADEKSDPQKVSAAVKDLGDRGYASDGLECDGRGNLYLTDYENNAIRRYSAKGPDQIVAQDPRMIWPDSIAIGADATLYFTANQLNRQKPYNKGKDLRQEPFVVFKTRPGEPYTALAE